MKKKRMIILAIIAVVIIGGYFGVTGIMSRIETSLKQLSDTPFANVDLSKVADGTYAGSYEVFPVAVDVKVIVKNHKILDIELLKHNNGQGAAAESIPGRVVKAQTLEVDIVSGATYSSKVILKAIENALNSSNK